MAVWRWGWAKKEVTVKEEEGSLRCRHSSRKGRAVVVVEAGVVVCSRKQYDRSRWEWAKAEELPPPQQQRQLPDRSRPLCLTSICWRRGCRASGCRAMPGRQ